MPGRPVVLVVDDEKLFLESLSERIEMKGFDVLTALSGREAIDRARNAHVDLAIVDHRLPDMDGLVVVEKLKELKPGLRTVLLTAYGDEKLQEAGEALETGYFEKGDMPRFWEFMQQIRSDGGMVIFPTGRGMSADAMEMFAAQQLVERRDRDPLEGQFGQAMPRLIGATPVMQELRETISKVASLDCTVLIRGETGTGKELVARSIHMASPRRPNRFLAINCGALSPELLSNELFGHEREAFTGAQRAKKGVFEAAAHGTIMLDEVGDTPHSMQVQLLRVLQEKTIIRVGGTQERPIDVRVLAATNRSLKDKVADGSFREDLFYRLNIFTLRIPPLRERHDDIAPLSSFFLAKYNREFSKEVERISDDVMGILLDYSFPGNVRELENIIERAVILCEGREIEPRHLPQRFQGSRAKSMRGNRFMTLAELEQQYIQEVLEGTNGNRSETARILGISRASLWRKLKQMDGYSD